MVIKYLVACRKKYLVASAAEKADENTI